MKFGGVDLSGDNLTLYEASTLQPNHVVLIRQGTIDDCIPADEPKRPIVLMPHSAAARSYGIGFLKAQETYREGKVLSLDAIEVIAGYGSVSPWEDFIRRMRLEKLREMTKTSSGIITLR